MIKWLAEVWPRLELLSWSLLRVQAFLELPFVVLAYLTICRWFCSEVFRRAAVWPVAVSYTAAFCLIEWSLLNPYTLEDIVLRVASGLVTPWFVARLSAGHRERADSVADLAVFVVSAAALGVLLPAVYETALLYNLGRLTAAAPMMAGAAVVLVMARLVARRLPTAQAGLRGSRRSARRCAGS
ncbi:hypothetical protein [Saccharopolyspora pogona]|uniref:hypothetical protein n=1 Tax=Saccharopolyspora pogona TaxID=333966 RepID=UPI00168785E8|nr:hypothetical protein [Saccharopolyspora pogona]